MRKTAIATLVSLLAVAALPAQASLADRKSDEIVQGPTQPSPYSGQVVIRGEVKSDDSSQGSAAPSPYSGQVVVRGEVIAESRS
jgi:hypothetical protein